MTKFSEVRSWLAKGFRKNVEKAARPLKIHREFIGLCENAGKRAQIRVLREE